MGGNTYNVTVTDANACTKQNSTTLTEPGSNDWATSGNSAANPSTQFIGTTDTSSVAFRTNNSEAMRIKNNGNVGIGTKSPQEKLHVGGKVRVDSLAFQTSDNSEVRLLGVGPTGVIKGLTITAIGSTIPVTSCTNPVLSWFNSSCSGLNPNNTYLMPYDGKVGIGTNNPLAKLDIHSDGSTTGIALQVKNYNGTTLFKVTDNGTIGMGPTMQINQNGQVGINWDFSTGKPSNTAYKLAVNGKIFAQGLTIEASTNWPDYVFRKDYSLLPLDDLRKFIEKNDRLPNMPSAEKIKTNGIDVEQINVVLVEKIEELTLYMLELKNQIDQLKKKLNEK